MPQDLAELRYGMGFIWARPTSLPGPIFTVGHAPLPYLRPVLGGPEAWEANETLRRAIEINDGVIRNPRILSFPTPPAAIPNLATDAYLDRFFDTGHERQGEIDPQ